MATPTAHRTSRGLRVTLDFGPEAAAVLMLAASQEGHRHVEDLIRDVLASHALTAVEDYSRESMAALMEKPR